MPVFEWLTVLVLYVGSIKISGIRSRNRSHGEFVIYMFGVQNQTSPVMLFNGV